MTQQIEFTPRIATYFKRFLEIKHKKIWETIDMLASMEGEDLFDRMRDGYLPVEINAFKGFVLRIRFDSELEEDYERRFIDPKSLQIQCHMVRLTTGDKVITIGDCDGYESNLEAMEEWINSLVKTYCVCKCQQNLEVKDGWCESCYPAVMTQDEDCCCCLENEGVWIELKCKHKLHKYCWRKVQGVKCPLCRNDNGFTVDDL